MNEGEERKMIRAYDGIVPGEIKYTTEELIEKGRKKEEAYLQLQRDEKAANMSYQKARRKRLLGLSSNG